MSCIKCNLKYASEKNIKRRLKVYILHWLKKYRALEKTFVRAGGHRLVHKHLYKCHIIEIYQYHTGTQNTYSIVVFSAEICLIQINLQNIPQISVFLKHAATQSQKLTV